MYVFFCQTNRLTQTFVLIGVRRPWNQQFRALGVFFYSSTFLKHIFKRTSEILGGIPWFGVLGANDIWQCLDGRSGLTLKRLINQEFFDWLDDNENLEKWYGANSYTTTDEKRILITNWAGNSYRKLTKPSYDIFRWRLSEKTGCLINADGSEDNKINPKDLPDY